MKRYSSKRRGGVQIASCLYGVARLHHAGDQDRQTGFPSLVRCHATGSDGVGSQDAGNVASFAELPVVSPADQGSQEM